MIKPKKHAFSALFQKESTAQLYHLCSAVMVEVTGLEDVGFQAKSTQNWEIFKFSWHF